MIYLIEIKCRTTLRMTKVTSKGLKSSQTSEKMKCRRRGREMLRTLIGWKDEVSSLPCCHVEYCSTTLFTFCWLVTVGTARHCRWVAESMNAQKSGRHATRLVTQSGGFAVYGYLTVPAPQSGEPIMPLPVSWPNSAGKRKLQPHSSLT